MKVFLHGHPFTKNLRHFSEVWFPFCFHEGAWCGRKCGSLKPDGLGFIRPFSYLPTHMISVTWISHLITLSQSAYMSNGNINC